MMTYWINTVSRDHVLTGIEGGFTQAGHGKNSGLKKMQKDDLMVFYSPKTELKGGESLQAFTALGRITDNEPYQFEMQTDFHPWRRKVNFFDCEEAPIRPLIDELDFIENKQYWGYPFRRGLFKIAQVDFERIAEAMEVKL